MNHHVLRAGALATFILFASAAPALATFPGHNGRIAFGSDRDGDDDVWTMNKQGNDLINLTADSPFFDGDAKWRPDGGKLVFVSGRATADEHSDVFTMDPDGRNVRQLTHNLLDDDEPAWSPDGQSIVFLRDLDPIQGQVDEDLIVLDLRTGHETNLTRSPGANEEQPSWSPDGKRIAYMSDVDGDADVYVITLRTGAIRNITNNTADDEFPNWSPDGGTLVFNSDLAQPGVHQGIWTMRPDGSDRRLLAADPAYSNAFPAWSPDGRSIVFSSKRTGTPQIFKMRADGSKQKPLAAAPGSVNGFPDWQPR